MQTINYKQPWIGRPSVDAVFILLPPFICLLIVILFPAVFTNTTAMSDVSWIVLVVLIDVAHVYSTLYRTYFDPQAMIKHRSLLWIVPFCGFIISVLIYSMSSIVFWRLLAYVAVFHFIRQQYGFMRIYSRKEAKNNLASRIDAIAIYTATLYPILFWHLDGARNFNWFIAGDFVFIKWDGLLRIATVLYYGIISIYLAKEIYAVAIYRHLNIPKFTIVSGTLLSWYFGIVYFNGDLAFTLLNVVSHGIPYMALIWIYGKKTHGNTKSSHRVLRWVFSKYGLIIFLGLIFLLALLEEALWEVAVWKEHSGIFFTNRFDQVTLNHQWLSLVVPLLAVPQITHYIVDGFIWKVKEDTSYNRAA